MAFHTDSGHFGAQASSCSPLWGVLVKASPTKPYLTLFLSLFCQSILYTMCI